jgi:hypothetical protein
MPPQNNARSTREESVTPRRRPFLVVGSIVVLVMLLGGVAYALTRDASDTPTSCAGAVDALVADVKKPNLAKEGLDGTTVRRSLVDCATPDAWRLRAERDGIGPVLGPYLEYPGLETDRALDLLCSNFDAGNGTNVCQHRHDP